MKKKLKRIAFGLSGLLAVAAFTIGGYAYSQGSSFDDSLQKVYSIPVRPLKAEPSMENIARGKHLAESLGGCALGECHGSNLAGGTTIELGPVGTIGAPNITQGGLGAVYSDGELVRLVEHGLTKSGRTVVFMTSHEFNWLPESDILAIIAYLRSLPAVEGPGQAVQVGLLGKVLDRRDEFVFDVARRINHEQIEKAPAPSPTKEYGQYIARLCTGCHGEGLGGGPIPGAPPDIPIPANITPHESGLKGWTFEQFEKLADQSIKQDGSPLDSFMPVEALSNMNETERKALFAFLTSVPPKEFGSR